MITKIWVNNFKSLVDFNIQLSDFNCLVGLNGSGKSTVLQFLDFLSQLMIGDIELWLSTRHWKASDLNSKISKKSNIEFKVTIESDGRSIVWKGSFNRTSLSCTHESVVVNNEVLLNVEDGKFTIGSTTHNIIFNYEGSLLSALKDKNTYKDLTVLRKTLIDIRSLELLSPEILRSKARFSEGKLGIGGENLSALIHESSSEMRANLITGLKNIYPQIEDIKTKSLRSGWKQLEVIESFDNKKITSVARHVNDGMLRLMAILLQIETKKSFLLFDEIENGINPELIEYLVDMLVNCDNQVMVTTHSPMILNYLEDDVAKKGVIYLYKNKRGATQSIRLFDIPSMAKKLQFMGPGEVFVDTDLTNLSKEIAGDDLIEKQG